MRQRDRLQGHSPRLHSESSKKGKTLPGCRGQGERPEQRRTPEGQRGPGSRTRLPVEERRRDRPRSQGRPRTRPSRQCQRPGPVPCKPKTGDGLARKGGAASRKGRGKTVGKGGQGRGGEWRAWPGQGAAHGAGQTWRLRAGGEEARCLPCRVWISRSPGSGLGPWRGQEEVVLGALAVSGWQRGTQGVPTANVGREALGSVAGCGGPARQTPGVGKARPGTVRGRPNLATKQAKENAHSPS